MCWFSKRLKVSGQVEVAVKCIRAERKARQAGRLCLQSTVVGGVKHTPHATVKLPDNKATSKCGSGSL